jgi:hypothetical protein
MDDDSRPVSVSAIAAAVDGELQPCVPAQRIHQPVLTGTRVAVTPRVPVQAGPGTVDVVERAMIGLGPIDPPLPCHLAAGDPAGWPVPDHGDVVVLLVDLPAAVALRVGRGAGPARVTASGTGAPPVTVLARVGHVFSGPGACDAWLTLHRGLCAGAVRAGDLVLLRIGRGVAEVWVELTVDDAAALRGPAREY